MNEEKSGVISMCFSTPLRFLEIKSEADALLEKDEKFKDFLSTIDSRYAKRNKQNKFNSLKMRFYVGFYLASRKRELKRLHIQKVTKEKPNENIINENTERTEEIKNIENIEI